MRRHQTLIVIVAMLLALAISFVARREKVNPPPRIQTPSISEVDLEGAA